MQIYILNFVDLGNYLSHHTISLLGFCDSLKLFLKK